jgi:hypothetical protein
MAVLPPWHVPPEHSEAPASMWQSLRHLFSALFGRREQTSPSAQRVPSSHQSFWFAAPGTMQLVSPRLPTTPQTLLGAHEFTVASKEQGWLGTQTGTVATWPVPETTSGANW